MVRYVIVVASSLAGLAASTTTTTANLLISDSIPKDASPVIDPKFQGFAFEQASFVEYAIDADGHHNVLSQNLMKELSTRTGTSRIIRVGGTSGDYGRFVQNQTQAALPVAMQNSTQNIGNTTIGPSYWKLFKSFPAASFVLDVPIGINNTAKSAQFAKAAVDAIGLENIEAIEIGNEPDLYPVGSANGTLVPPTYQGRVTNASYVYTFGAFASAISSALQLPANEPVFQAFDTSHHFNNAEGYILDVPTVFGLGLNVNKTIKAVSHHYYQTNPLIDLSKGFLNHTAISTGLDYYKPFIAYCQSTKTGTHSSPIPFVLGEVGNSLNGQNNYAYQNVLGSTLWQVDFQLYALSIGVARIYWQQIMHAGYNMWLPIPSGGLPAQVFTVWYSMPFIADFISHFGNTRVAQLNLQNAPNNNVVAYAAYDSTIQYRVALVNLNFWNTTVSSSAARPSVNVTLRVPKDVTGINVKVLNSPEGATANATSVTYGGSQWTAASKGMEVKGVDKQGSYRMSVQGGKVVLGVQDSSALLVTLMRGSK